MTHDFDDLLDDLDGSAPGELIELARKLRGGRPSGAVFAWSNGRILAKSRADGTVRIERRYGALGSPGGMRLDQDELGALDAACRDWRRNRDLWAAFYSSGIGPPGFGCGLAWYVVRPGAGEEPERIGMRFFRGTRSTEGRPLRGRDLERPLAERASVAAGVFAREETIRVGEVETPTEGLRVGLVYDLGYGLTLRARRGEAELLRGSSSVWLEAEEDRFAGELLAAVGRA